MKFKSPGERREGEGCLSITSCQCVLGDGACCHERSSLLTRAGHDPLRPHFLFSPDLFHTALHNPTPAAVLHHSSPCTPKANIAQLPPGRPPTQTAPTQTSSDLASTCGPSFVQRAISKLETAPLPRRGAASVLRREEVLGRYDTDHRHRYLARGTYAVGSPRAWQHQAHTCSCRPVGPSPLRCRVSREVAHQTASQTAPRRHPCASHPRLIAGPRHGPALSVGHRRLLAALRICLPRPHALPLPPNVHACSRRTPQASIREGEASQASTAF